MLFVNRLEHTNVFGVLSGSLDKVGELAAAVMGGEERNTRMSEKSEHKNANQIK